MNIYVGNLSYETTEEDLREAFSPFGQVDSISIIKDKFTGKSKGFGFVEMSDKTEAQAAIEGDTAVVWSDEISAPAAVRFGWTNDAMPDLFNKAGLPASPFRTDDWPGVTFGKN